MESNHPSQRHLIYSQARYPYGLPALNNGWLNPPCREYLWSSLTSPIKCVSCIRHRRACTQCALQYAVCFLLGESYSRPQGTLSVHISILLEVTYYPHTYFDFRSRTSVSSDFNLPLPQGISFEWTSQTILLCFKISNLTL